MGYSIIVTPLTVPGNTTSFLFGSKSYHEPSGLSTMFNPDAWYELLYYPESFSGAAGEFCQ